MERDRENRVSTRNIRLAAIKSFFRYLEYRVPNCLDHALQVRAIQQKRADKPLIDWLDRTEMQAILDAPDILKKHVATAARKVPSIEGKRVTPHVLRHSTAMTILHATGDIRKVSLWLGHANIKTTEAYLRASPAEKLRILETNVPPSIRPGTFPGATDSLMRVLGGRGRLELMPSESEE